MASNQEKGIVSLEAAIGFSAHYNSEWEALWDLSGTAAHAWNGRMLAWINDKLKTSYTNLPQAQQAFADYYGAYNWSSLGSFDAVPGVRGIDLILRPGATSPSDVILRTV